jgi:hypothetical protein
MFGHDNNHQNQDDNNGQTHFDSAAGGSTQTDSAVVTPAAPQDDQANNGSHMSGFETTPVGGGNGTPAGPATDDLLDIKQEALQALTPLVGQLDQTPEEQFRTTMMMIQASDNHSLIKVAYDAAKQIGNEKERAQALLDIVNEINYFTQHNQA